MILFIMTNDITQVISFWKMLVFLKAKLLVLCVLINKKKVTSVDMFTFRYQNKTFLKYKYIRPMRTNLFLEEFNIPLSKFIHFISFYVEKLNEKI